MAHSVDAVKAAHLQDWNKVGYCQRHRQGNQSGGWTDTLLEMLFHCRVTTMIFFFSGRPWTTISTRAPRPTSPSTISWTAWALWRTISPTSPCPRSHVNPAKGRRPTTCATFASTKATTSKIALRWASQCCCRSGAATAVWAVYQMDQTIYDVRSGEVKIMTSSDSMFKSTIFNVFSSIRTTKSKLENDVFVLSFQCEIDSSAHIWVRCTTACW